MRIFHIMFLSNNKQPFKLYAFIAFSIFLLIFCLLGPPFTKWGFKTDDWGNVYHATTRHWYDWLGFFTEGSSEKVFHPCNLPPAQEAFFQGLYRPLSFIYYALQHALFGYNPYGYFLVTIALHACNASLFFLLLRSFAPLLHAVLAALLFGFHPTLYNWLGWTSAQTYFIELFVLFLTLTLLQHYLNKQHWYIYAFACFLYLANLFLKEQTILLPLWLVYAYSVYDVSRGRKKIINALNFSLGFWLMSCIYLAARLQFFPLTRHTATLTFEPTWQSFATRMSSRFYDFVTYINDLIGFVWLPQGNRLLKGSLISLVLFAACWLFYHNTKKKYVSVCFAGILLLSWPALLMHYQPRYIYMALPFFLCTSLLLIQFYKGPKPPRLIKKFIYTTLLCLITYNITFIHQHLRTREHDLHIITTAFKKLIAKPVVRNRVLGFIALPQRWFHQGTAQAVWMLNGNFTLPVYQWNVPFNHLDGNLPAAKISFEKTHVGLACTTQTPSILWFIDDAGNQHKQVIININKEYQQQNPLFIAWDYQHKQFRVLE